MYRKTSLPGWRKILLDVLESGKSITIHCADALDRNRTLYHLYSEKKLLEKEEANTDLFTHSKLVIGKDLTLEHGVCIYLKRIPAPLSGLTLKDIENMKKDGLK